MTDTASKLYELLPAIYRIRDAEQGEPLKALLSVMASQIHLVEEDIDQLYENWFIETCQEWLVPYIGDLLGVRPLPGTGDDVFSRRAYVANTLAYRRRKGTLAVLEELARNVTGWPAKAVEYFELLATSQHLNHLRLHRAASIQIGSNGARSNLERLGGPFETAAHTADVRRIESHRGMYNLPNIGLHLWRLAAYHLVRGDARAASDAPSGCWRFHPMGYDAPLFNAPQTEEGITHLAEEINVPGLLRRFPLYLELEARRVAISKKLKPASLYFGENPVFEIFISGKSKPLAPEEILIGNLANWEKPGWTPPQPIIYAKDSRGKTLTTKCVVDPELGRIAFHQDDAPEKVSVTYAHGFSGNLGGGPYDRRRSVQRWHFPNKQNFTWMFEVTRATAGHTLADALNAWNTHNHTHRQAFGLICITDNATYAEVVPDIEIRGANRLAIVASLLPLNATLTPDNLRPHIIGDLVITKPSGLNPERGNLRGSVIIDGLLVEGAVSVKSCNLGLLHLAHCTLASPCNNQRPTRSQPSVSVASGNTGLQVVMDSCITETIRSAPDIQSLKIFQSLIDAGENDATVLAGLTGNAFGPPATIERSTLFGRTFVRELSASESIFTAEVQVERCQMGCMRFSWLRLPADPAETPQTPPRYRCQPCLEITTQDEKNIQDGKFIDPLLVRKRVSLWLAPGFSSRAFAHPAYGQLRLSTPAQIRTGAEDGSQMGAFCFLKQPQREAGLRAALIEYLRSGLEAGIFYVREENHQLPGGTK